MIFGGRRGLGGVGAETARWLDFLDLEYGEWMVCEWDVQYGMSAVFITPAKMRSGVLHVELRVSCVY